jgi:PAS domain S-box-containing protein
MQPENIKIELEQEKKYRRAAELRIAELELALNEKKKRELTDNNISPYTLEVIPALEPLWQAMQEGILIENEAGKIVFLNEKFGLLFKLSDNTASYIGTPTANLLKHLKSNFKKPAAFIGQLKHIALQGKAVLALEAQLEDGRILSIDYLPTQFQTGERFNFWKFTDITAQKVLVYQKQELTTFFERILNNTPGSIAAFSPDHRYLFVNKESVKNPALRAWIIGKNDEEYCLHTNKSLDLATVRKQKFQQLKETGKPVEWEEQFKGKDGEIEYHLRKLYPITNESGELEMVIGYGVNITEKKKIEAQALDNEKRYVELFNFSQACICTHSLDGKFISINPAGCRMLGFSEEELKGRGIDSFLSPAMREHFEDSYLNKIIAEGKAEGVMEIFSKSGEKRHMLFQNYLLSETKGEPYIIGFAQNITDRYEAEDALLRSEEKYRGIIDNMNLGMLEMDGDERIIFANQRFCAMSGYEPEELYSKKATDLFLENDEARNVSEIARKRQYRISNNYEFKVKTKKGNEKWWLVSTSPLHNADGTLKGAVSIHLDITRQKKMEQEMKAAITDAEKSSNAKEAFLANMSHEIRTPINAIMGLGKLLSKSNLDEQQRFFLTSIRTASENLLVIINDILDISKIEAGKISLEHIPLDLNKISEQAVNMLQPKAEEKELAIHCYVDDSISHSLLGDPYRINQVLINMLSNAIKFTEKGQVTLRATLIRQEGAMQTVQIVIEDTGIGINEEFLEQIFNKFTQEDDSIARKFGGTGLGMSITRQLMELMGGTIAITSKKNAGTTVTLTLTLKIASQKILEKKKAVKSDSSSIGNKQILLVEDNELNRLLAYTILTQYGAIVTTANNGAIAIDLIRKQQFDIVLMDVQMPVLDGVTATTIIRKEIDNAIPIIALTANALKGKKEQYLEAGMNDYITKPYDEEKMISVIALWLQKSPGHTPRPIAPTETNAVFPVLQENAAPLFDIKKLIAIGGDNTDFVTQMLSLFVTDVPQSMSKMKTAYVDGDFKTVKYLAHRIRPSIMNMCINSIKEETVQVERLAEKEVHSPELEQMIDKMVNVINTVSAQLKSEHNI